MAANKMFRKFPSAKPRKQVKNYHKAIMTCDHVVLFESYPPALGEAIWCVSCGAYRKVSGI